ncbi:hypothetical protein NLG97_g1551 [Lecanicillium saksenae]|uniref:Uncharacterized protein n=1 Tax=Lecanicillium saksenae TaxID=468837 RepID=A0ACC1R3G0_9HYPO|nr:hypothetical protein NLG97_g1551 [Lecanicillium saksenae]
MSALPPHKGILQPATVALRHILSYSDYSLYHPSALTNANFAAKLDGSILTDILFLSVDIDTGSLLSYRVLDDEKQYSIGISVLDTREIHERLKAEFDSIVRGREYVLVFHGAIDDMRVLSQLNIGQEPSYIFGTALASQFPLQLHYRPSSERLLHLLGIRFRDLHAAGNDAHFVLRAFLMIAVHDSQTQHIVPSEAELQLLVTLEEIARYPIPDPKPKPPAKPPRIKHPKQPKKTDTARTRRRNRTKLELEAQTEIG